MNSNFVISDGISVSDVVKVDAKVADNVLIPSFVTHNKFGILDLLINNEEGDVELVLADEIVSTCKGDGQAILVKVDDNSKKDDKEAGNVLIDDSMVNIDNDQFVHRNVDDSNIALLGLAISEKFSCLVEDKENLVEDVKVVTVLSNDCDSLKVNR